LNFLADESCDFRIVRALREAGHDVIAISEFAKRMDDSSVINLSLREHRVLITEDKDFGQLVYAHGRASRGVILIRYPASLRERLCRDVVKLAEQGKERLGESFVVIEPWRIRMTRLPRSI
jgi:predicted nuclease of predicted toxin-antitoxin system